MTVDCEKGVELFIQVSLTDRNGWICHDDISGFHFDYFVRDIDLRMLLQPSGFGRQNQQASKYSDQHCQTLVQAMLDCI